MTGRSESEPFVSSRHRMVFGVLLTIAGIIGLAFGTYSANVALSSLAELALIRALVSTVAAVGLMAVTAIIWYWIYLLFVDGLHEGRQAS